MLNSNFCHSYSGLFPKQVTSCRSDEEGNIESGSLKNFSGNLRIQKLFFKGFIGHFMRKRLITGFCFFVLFFQKVTHRSSKEEVKQVVVLPVGFLIRLRNVCCSFHGVYLLYIKYGFTYSEVI